MSAIELLEQVKEHLEHLSACERQQFFERLMSLEEYTPATQDVATTPPKWPDIAARHQRIFGGQVLSENIVLAAREEESR